jgi:hypothetical protein
MASQGPGYLAGGTIYPSKFVTQDNQTVPFQCVQAVSGSVILGVSDYRVNQIPGTLGAASLPIPAATVGQPIMVFRDDEECLLTAGAAVSAGQYLTSDANGNAVPINKVGSPPPTQSYGAIANEFQAVTGVLFRATCKVGFYP